MPKKGGDIDPQAQRLREQRMQQARLDRLAAAQLNTQPTTSETPYTVAIHASALAIPRSALIEYAAMNREIAVENAKKGTNEHAEHITKSKQSILETADVALGRMPQNKPKKALILGAGNCTDIPLEQLAQRFDNVTVVELDQQSAESAIKALPKDLQEKITLVVADITGVAGEFISQVEGALDRATADKRVLVSKAIMRFDTEAADITADIDASLPSHTPDFGDEYAFVCSQLVMSQLANLPRLAIDTAFSTKIPGFHLSGRPGGLDNAFFMNVQSLTATLMIEHLQLLGNAVAPEGTVHFADTYARLIPNPVRRQEDSLPMLIPAITDPVIADLFTPLHDPEVWIWNHTPGIQRFAVMANAFEPKSIQ